MKHFVGLFSIFVTLAAGGVAVHAQQTKVPRVGYVATTSAGTPNNQAFFQGLRDLGYINGKNIVVEDRYARGQADRIPGLVAELVQLKVDVLVSPVTDAIRKAKESTRTIPVIMAIADDPVAAGLVDSLAHPGGNITGLTRLTKELNGKRLELLKEILPGVSRVGILLVAGFNVFGDYEVPARALKLQLHSIEMQSPKDDLATAFRTALERHAGALVATRSLIGYRKQISDLTIAHRLPVVSEGSDFVAAGVPISYASDDVENYRRAAYYVDKILKGAKPADLPVEQPTKFELVINLKTAKRIGLTIPPNVLARADRVIK
jgi:putative ABC transport system substrate-binding protein